VQIDLLRKIHNESGLTVIAPDPGVGCHRVVGFRLDSLRPAGTANQAERSDNIGNRYETPADSHAFTPRIVLLH
jgi:hypothetical protein